MVGVGGGCWSSGVLVGVSVHLSRLNFDFPIIFGDIWGKYYERIIVMRYNE